jgi:hypothetical protein
MAPAVSTSGPCGSAAAATSRHCATLLDRPPRPAVGSVHPRPTTLFGSAPTSHWPAPAGQWTYGGTLLHSLLFGVDRGRSTPSLWCVPIWAEGQNDIRGMKPCRPIHLPPVDPSPYKADSPGPAMSGIGSEEDCAGGELSSAPLSPVLDPGTPAGRGGSSSMP